VAKKMRISKGNGTKKDGICTKIARITGASYDYVRRVRLGERNNQMIEDMLCEYAEGENKLLQHVEEIMADYTENQRINPHFARQKRVKQLKTN
jgi:hypothetical protein